MKCIVVNVGPFPIFGEKEKIRPTCGGQRDSLDRKLVKDDQVLPSQQSTTQIISTTNNTPDLPRISGSHLVFIKLPLPRLWIVEQGKYHSAFLMKYFTEILEVSQL